MLSRAFTQLAATDGLEGAEREPVSEWAKFQPDLSAFGWPNVAGDPHRMFIPWPMLARDVYASADSAGSFLIGVNPAAAVDILRPWSVVIGAGVNLLDQFGRRRLPNLRR